MPPAGFVSCDLLPSMLRADLGLQTGGEGPALSSRCPGYVGVALSTRAQLCFCFWRLLKWLLRVVAESGEAQIPLRKADLGARPLSMFSDESRRCCISGGALRGLGRGAPRLCASESNQTEALPRSRRPFRSASDSGFPSDFTCSMPRGEGRAGWRRGVL